ncbi:MAG: hypothetical protein F6K11_23940, partial [Leptolyngbya sp. SIO3F4]|nr:hypothetical protein [Leptolyngbya sp. SIO3F4]
MSSDITRKVKVLFLGLAPYIDDEFKDKNYLHLGWSHKVIWDTIQKSAYKRNLELYTFFDTKGSDIYNIVPKCKPNIIHICGHANTKVDQEGLYFFGDEGKPINVRSSEIKELFNSFKGDTKLLFLDGCKTNSIANAIVDSQGSINYVIGWKSVVSEKFSTKLTSVFYHEILCSAQPLGNAVERACAQAKVYGANYEPEVHSSASLKHASENTFFPLSITPNMDDEIKRLILENKYTDFYFLDPSNGEKSYNFGSSQHKYFEIVSPSDELSHNDNDFKRIFIGVSSGTGVGKTAQLITDVLFENAPNVDQYGRTIVRTLEVPNEDFQSSTNMNYSGRLVGIQDYNSRRISSLWGRKLYCKSYVQERSPFASGGLPYSLPSSIYLSGTSADYI